MRIKKLIAICLVIIVTSALCAPVAMAGSAEAEQVLTRLRELASRYSSITSKNIAEATNWLRNEENADLIDASTANEIIALINQSDSIAKGTSSLSKLSLADKTDIFDNICAAAGLVGLTVGVDASSGRLTIYDTDGSVITTLRSGSSPTTGSRSRSSSSSVSGVIKQTGIDASGFVGLLAFGAVITFLPMLGITICLVRRRTVTLARAQHGSR